MRDSLNSYSTDVEKLENWALLTDNPVVSIAILTYNHFDYINLALDSILEQKVDFDFEVIIADDCSSDGTIDEIKKFYSNHPDIVRLRIARANLYSQNIDVSVGLLQACRGKYIAVLDGDDYWVDNCKLQKQVDCLEADLSLSMCAHNSYIQYGKETLDDTLMWDDSKNEFTEEDIILGVLPDSSSFLIRNTIPEIFPDYFFKLCSGDWPLYIMSLHHGGLCYLPEVMGVWRKHGNGICGGDADDRWQLKLAKSYVFIEKIFSGRYRPIILSKMQDLVFCQLRKSHGLTSKNKLEDDLFALVEYSRNLPDYFKLPVRYDKIIRAELARIALWKSFQYRNRAQAWSAYKSLLRVEPLHFFSRKNFLQLIRLIRIA